MTNHPIFRKGISMNSTNKFLLNILQSMGQAIHILDATGMVTYWNRSAEEPYGYSASEALGQDIIELIVEREDREEARHINRKNASSANWTGTFPVKNKQGKRIFVHITLTHLYDDDGNNSGIICVSADAQNFLQTPTVSSSKVNSSTLSHPTSTEDIDSQQPLQIVVTPSGARIITGDVPLKVSPVEKLSGRKFEGYGAKGEGMIGTSTTVACINKKNISWPWKVSQHDGLVARTRHYIFACCMRKEQENDFVRSKSSASYRTPKVQVLGSNNQFANEATDSNATAKISVSLTSNTIRSPLCKFDTVKGVSDYDILWEELRVGEKLGR
ncbi:hypothetical protein MKX03_005871, partial [Papaver bracteatum]